MPTQFNEIKILSMPLFQDERGSFRKIFQSVPPLDDYSIKQINLVENKTVGILRGLHFQRGVFAESKIFQVLSGKIQLVIVDIREKSKTYKECADFYLDSSNQAIWIPRGFATGYAVLQDSSTVLYTSDKIYNLNEEGGIRWNDPIININWKVNSPKLSEKDKEWEDFK